MKLILPIIFFLSFSAYADKKSITELREERRVFFEANPKEALKEYDDLELDLLYKDLENSTILELKSKYPELTPKELEELKTKRK
ncbi:MAG: hypothetical protein V4598_12530 [Bdellovibrionota bacterium]